MTASLRTLLAMILLGCLGTACAADWPQWRGPNRDGISAETGLLKQWPAEGPKKLWSASGLGFGYASVAVVGDRIYTTGMSGKDGYLVCLDTSGKLLWKNKYGPEHTGGYGSARTTPTVVGDKVYLISGVGGVYCLDAKDGKPVWSVDTRKEYGAQGIGWGIAESPLVTDGKVIATPGGKSACIVALDAETGKEAWTCAVNGEKSAYCSPVLVERGKKKIVVTMPQTSVVGVDLATGKLLWHEEFPTKYDVHACSPVYSDGQLFVTAGYKAGASMYALGGDGSSVRKKYHTDDLDNHHGGVVLLDGYVYGAQWPPNGVGKEFRPAGNFVCLKLGDGSLQWKNNLDVGKGSVIYADGHLYCYGQTGLFSLVTADPKKPAVKGVFKVEEGEKEHWAHPAIADGVLYVRHGDALMAYAIK